MTYSESVHYGGFFPESLWANERWILNNVDQPHRTFMKRASVTIFRISGYRNLRDACKSFQPYITAKVQTKIGKQSAPSTYVYGINLVWLSPLFSGTWVWGCWTLSHPWAECPARPRWSAPPAGYSHQQTSQFQILNIPVLRIHDILVPCGSCCFRHWPSRRQQKVNKLIFFTKVFLLITF